MRDELCLEDPTTGQKYVFTASREGRTVKELMDRGIGVVGGQLALEPAPKQPVNLKKLVGTKVICEFWDKPADLDRANLEKGFLTTCEPRKDGSTWYERDGMGPYKRCRPAFDLPQPLLWGWNGVHVLPEGLRVQVYRHDNFPTWVDRLPARGDIFRIIGLQVGYCYPWEV